MKILTTPHVEHYTLGLVEALLGLGVKVTLVTIQRRYGVAARHYPVPRVPVPRRREWLQHAALAALAPFHDVVHANNSSEGVASRAYDHLLVTQHGCPDPAAVEEGLRWFYEREVRSLLSLHEIGVPIVTISYFSASEMREKLGVKVTRVIHHGLLSMFRRERARAFRAPHTVLWVSRLVPFKEPFVLLRAVDRIKGEAAFRVIISGDGPLREHVLSFAERRNLGGRLTLLKVPFHRMPLVYGEATIYVHTCSREAFGFSVLEAMGSGLPVVVPDAGGAAEVTGDAGVKFRAGDSDDLADKLLAVMQDPELYEKLSRRSLERARAFDWSAAARSYLELYEKVRR